MNCPWCGASPKRTENVGLYFECDSAVQPDSILTREQSDTCKLASSVCSGEFIDDIEPTAPAGLVCNYVKSALAEWRAATEGAEGDEMSEPCSGPCCERPEFDRALFPCDIKQQLAAATAEIERLRSALRRIGVRARTITHEARKECAPDR